MTCSFDDALGIRHGVEDVSAEFMHKSTILPVLLLWAAAFEMDDAYKFLVEQVVPAVPDTSVNLWSSDKGFDQQVASQSKLRTHGVEKVLLDLPALPSELLALLSTPLPGLSSISVAPWFRLRAAYIPLLAGLHWKLKVPREMLVQHMLAAVADVKKPRPTSLNLAI